MFSFFRNLFPSNVVTACFEQVTLLLFFLFSMRSLFYQCFIIFWSYYYFLLSQYKTAYSKNSTVEANNLTEATESSKSDLDLTGHLHLVYVKNLISNTNTGNSPDDQVALPGSISAVNILGLLTLCIAFGLVLGRMGDDGKPLRDFFKCLNQATMHLIEVAIW